MADGARVEAWNHTASIVATLINTRAFRKGAAVSPAQMHPYAKSLPKRKLSREESRRRLHEMVGIKPKDLEKLRKRHARNSTHANDSAGKVEPDGRGPDDGGAG